MMTIRDKRCNSNLVLPLVALCLWRVRVVSRPTSLRTWILAATTTTVMMMMMVLTSTRTAPPTRTARLLWALSLPLRREDGAPGRDQDRLHLASTDLSRGDEGPGGQ